MADLTQEQIDQVVAVNRRTLIAVVVVIALLVVGLVLLIVLFPDRSPRIVGGGAIGVLIGWLLTLPGRRLHARLGLTQVQARMIVEQQRRLRRGLPAVSGMDERLLAAQRSRRMGLIVLVVGLLVLAPALPAAIVLGGRTYGEGESQLGPTTAFLGVIAGGIATLTGLVMFGSARKVVAAIEATLRRGPVQ